MAKTCSFDGCEKPNLAKTLCAGHYMQIRQGRELRPLRATKPHARRPKGMSEDDWFWHRADKSEGCWPWTAATTREGYGELRRDQQMVYAHRVAYELTYGPIPAGRAIDHQCRNRACVNPAHLLAVTPKENSENLGIAANNSSGVRGVSWAKHAKAWRVQVGHRGEHFDGGYYQALADAERAAVALRNKLFTNNVADRVRA